MARHTYIFVVGDNFEINSSHGSQSLELWQSEGLMDLGEADEILHCGFIEPARPRFSVGSSASLWIWQSLGLVYAIRTSSKWRVLSGRSGCYWR